MDAWYNAKLFSSNQKCAAFKMQLCFLFTAAVDFPLKSKSNKGCSELCNSVQNSWLYQLLAEYQERTYERKEREVWTIKYFSDVILTPMHSTCHIHFETMWSFLHYAYVNVKSFDAFPYIKAKAKQINQKSMPTT